MSCANHLRPEPDHVAPLFGAEPCRARPVLARSSRIGCRPEALGAGIGRMGQRWPMCVLLEPGKLEPVIDHHTGSPARVQSSFRATRCACVALQERIFFTVGKDAARAEIQPFPDQSRSKGVLRRLVQFLKRHRDHHFLKIEDDIAPMSIIITTLSMRSYDRQLVTVIGRPNSRVLHGDGSFYQAER